MATDVYKLYGCPGWGSSLVECFLALAGVESEFHDVCGFDAPGPARDRLLKVNALAQVPTLILPDQMVMTESAAIALLATIAWSGPTEAGAKKSARATASPLKNVPQRASIGKRVSAIP